jgi:hypothetical protein
MVGRLTHVRLENQSWDVKTLRRTDMGLSELGAWMAEPPKVIGPITAMGEWESLSVLPAMVMSPPELATEGWVTYQLEGATGRASGELRLRWRTPATDDDNSYQETVNPAGSRSGEGFSVVHLGGDGEENANVTFVLLDGFCTAGSDGIVCTREMALEPETSESPRYAAIWEETSGQPWCAQHGLTSDQYQKAFDSLTGKGFRLTQVSGYSIGGEDRYAAIFEQRPGPPFTARHGLTSDQYQKAFEELTGKGFRLSQVSGYSIAERPVP